MRGFLIRYGRAVELELVVADLGMAAETAIRVRQVISGRLLPDGKGLIADGHANWKALLYRPLMTPTCPTLTSSQRSGTRRFLPLSLQRSTAATGRERSDRQHTVNVDIEAVAAIQFNTGSPYDRVNRCWESH